MAYRNLIPMIHRLVVERKEHLIKHIEELMKNPKNNPILEDLIQFLRDVDYKLTQAQKKARMSIPFRM